MALTYYLFWRSVPLSYSRRVYCCLQDTNAGLENYSVGLLVSYYALGALQSYPPGWSRGIVNRWKAKMKLYYTGPLAAVYMAREFGVGFVRPIKNLDNALGGCWWTPSTEEPNISAMVDEVEDCDEPSYYVYPDSYHIFEPQHGDVLLQNRAVFIWGGGYNGQNVKTAKIIQRDGKQFFMPGVGND